MIHQLITYQDNRIILSHERRNKATLDIYPSQHLLTYIREGMLKVKLGKDTQCFVKGEFVLFRKFTPATITKTWRKQDVKFSSIVFTFQEDLVKEVFKQLDMPEPLKNKEACQSILGVNSNPLLNQFINSLQLFFEGSLKMDNHLAKLKTLEALIGLTRADENLIYQLQHFSDKSKADLFRYMNFHYLENKKLEDFAKGSGRSLTTFKKDFQSIFNTTPGKWLKKKRLEHAYKLLTSTNRKPSEIYLECGFEDLGHFSKSFKSAFNVNPSEVS